MRGKSKVLLLSLLSISVVMVMVLSVLLILGYKNNIYSEQGFVGVIKSGCMSIFKITSSDIEKDEVDETMAKTPDNNGNSDNNSYKSPDNLVMPELPKEFDESRLEYIPEKDIYKDFDVVYGGIIRELGYYVLRDGQFVKLREEVRPDWVETPYGKDLKGRYKFEVRNLYEGDKLIAVADPFVFEFQDGFIYYDDTLRILWQCDKEFKTFKKIAGEFHGLSPDDAFMQRKGVTNWTISPDGNNVAYQKMLGFVGYGPNDEPIYENKKYELHITDGINDQVVNSDVLAEGFRALKWINNDEILIESYSSKREIHTINIKTCENKLIVDDIYNIVISKNTNHFFYCKRVGSEASEKNSIRAITEPYFVNIDTGLSIKLPKDFGDGAFDETGRYLVGGKIDAYVIYLYDSKINTLKEFTETNKTGAELKIINNKIYRQKARDNYGNILIAEIK